VWRLPIPELDATKIQNNSQKFASNPEISNVDQQEKIQNILKIIQAAQVIQQVSEKQSRDTGEGLVSQ